MHRLWIQFVLIAHVFAAVFCEIEYTIVAPKFIQSNQKYSVAINLHDAPTPATIRVSIVSSAGVSTRKMSQEVTVNPHATKLIDFMPSKLFAEYSHELQVEGIEGIELNGSSQLLPLTHSALRIYIESDREIYKPGDIVQFRLFILDEHLRPLNIIEPIRVQISDAERHRVKQFKDIKLKRGVFAAKFPLSKEPILGTWKITVFISGKYSMERYKNFQVDKYVLPMFSVYVEIDPNFVEGDRFLKANVYAKYTFGEYVEGTAELMLLNIIDRKAFDTTPRIVTIENGTVKGEVVFDTLNVNFRPYGSSFIVFATFKEKLTNIKATGEAKVKVRSKKYNILIPESGIEFRNEQPYRMMVHIEYWNGTRIKDDSTPVTMSLGNNKYTTFMDDEGTAQFEFEYDPELDFKIEYNGVGTIFKNIFGIKSSYDYGGIQRCKIRMQGRSSAHAFAPIKFEVVANETIPYIFCTIASHGNIIRQEYIQVPDNQKSHVITLDVSFEMIPQCYVYVHYIVNNQLIYCEFNINLPEEFQNKISITAPASVKPGQEITLTIEGEPNSHVSIVAVDKRVLLLNSKHVLQKSRIMTNLRFYAINEYAFGYHVYYPGFISGLITITSAKFETRQFYRSKSISSHVQPDSIKPRTLFPETWIYEDMQIDKAVTSVKMIVPDTITTWVIRAFSVNDHTGFGMMDTSVNIVAFQPFFISTNLPYVVKRGEVVTIPITIFNYFEQSYQTEVIMDNSKAEFSFMDNENRRLNLTTNSKIITIPANNGKSVAFVITVKKLGDIEIRITANNSKTSDAILQRLKVEPSGIKQQYNRDTLLTLSQGQSQKIIFQAPMPSNIVPESEHVTLSVSGNALVTTLENLDDLVLKPTGCGEQNMINLAPNILALDYLKAIGKYYKLPELVARAKSFIDTGYQQELTYRHSNGGYSVFGPKSSNKQSNWLTAYVIRFFIKGLKYSAIEARIVESDLEFLAKQQEADGSFPHGGYLFHQAHRNRYGLTAFVLLTFLEDEKYSRKYSKIIENGMNFLTANLESISDIYSLAIMANVFQKTENSYADEIISKLKSRKKTDHRWWTHKEDHEITANNVEITAYTLMALLATPDRNAAAFGWLIEQRNIHGGFGSTQDTVVGLQALIKYAKMFSQTGQKDTQVEIHYVAKDESGQNVKTNILEINTENKLTLQKQLLPPSTRTVEVEVNGHGDVYLQFAFQYYISTDNGPRLADQPETQNLTSIANHLHFVITPEAKLSLQSKSMTLSVCYMYQPQKLEDTQTNMVILQIELPSGFVTNGDNIEKLEADDQIRRVEIRSSSTILALYFERLEANDEQCLTILADRLHEVQSLKSSKIEIYDFYNPEIRSEVLYDVSM